MNITLNIKPLSINDAYKGRHFPTAAKTHFENSVRWMLPNKKIEGRWFRLEYKFFLKNFSLTDVGNLEKIITDCIVKRGIILDDRLITELRLRKFPSKQDRIEVEIYPTDIEDAEVK